MSEFDPMSLRTLSPEARDAAAREVVTVIAGNLDAALPFQLIGCLGRPCFRSETSVAADLLHRLTSPVSHSSAVATVAIAGKMSLMSMS